jgi:MFS family permease
MNNFNKFFFAEIISNIGNQLSFIALPIAVVLYSNASPQEMGWVIASQQVPFILLSFYAGDLVDRYGAKPFMVTSDILRGIGCILIGQFILKNGNSINISWFYLFAFLMGSLTVAYKVASAAIISLICNPDERLSANSRLSMVTSLAETIGPGVAAIIIQQVGAAYVIMLDGITFFLSAYLIGLILLNVSQTGQNDILVKKKIGLKASFIENCRYIIGNRTLLNLLVLIGLWNFLIQISLVNFILFATRDLNFSVSQYGFILSLSGIGFFVGASFASKHPWRNLHLKVAVCSMASFYFICFLTPILSSLTVSFLVTGILFFVGGIFVALFIIHSSTLRQIITPKEHQGGVVGLFQTVSWGCMPIGAVFGGAIGQIFGARTALIMMGIIGICAVGLVHLIFSLLDTSSKPTQP